MRCMKETMTYCVENFEQAAQEADESKACEKPYILPDGRKVILGNNSDVIFGKERFCTPEILFDPARAERADIDTERLFLNPLD